jgi:hypothetical protein
MKQLILATAAVFVLSTAVATNASNGAQTAHAATTAQTAPSGDLSLQAAARIVSLWKDHANAAASTPLARPL